MLPNIDFESVMRRAKGLKSSRKFHEELENIRILVAQVENSRDKKLKRILSEYIIIKLVSIFEYNFKSIVLEMIDEEDFNYDEEVKLSFSDLKTIQKTKEITVGKIIATTRNFQNIENIDKILSSLLGASFLKELKKTYGYEIQIKTVQECLDKRHQIIHEMKHVPISKKQLRKYSRLMVTFMIDSMFCSALLAQRKKSEKTI